MNLIEQLGGYKNSKGIREAYLKNGWSISDVSKGFHVAFTVEDLDKALLEHRRANNIFEIGDFVIDTISNQFFRILKIEGDSFVNQHLFWCRLEWIRHATPEEIAAGHRID